MGRTITKAFEVPKPGSKEHRALGVLLGLDLTAEANGFLVGYAAGKAAAQMPTGCRILRVVVVAETE